MLIKEWSHLKDLQVSNMDPRPIVVILILKSKGKQFPGLLHSDGHLLVDAYLSQDCVLILQRLTSLAARTM